MPPNRATAGGNDTVLTTTERVVACDLIIDATGDVPSALMLGALAAESKKGFVSIEVFEGGFGCLVARSVPGRDPAYVAGRAAYSAYCEQQNVAPPPSGRHTYDVLTEAGELLVADDDAVFIAAAHAARVALDILDGQIGVQDAAWLLIGFRDGWLFKRHGNTISLDVGPASAAPRSQRRTMRRACSHSPSRKRRSVRLRLEILREALQRAGTKEIGGQIYGEQLAPSDFQATELTFQKRLGTFARFIVDLVQAARDAVRFFQRTQHRYTRYNYIGEWHSHPNFEVKPSGTDIAAMRGLVSDPEFKGRFAALMITRLDGDRLTRGAWLFDPDGREFAITLELQL
jgi:hypothetical protein